MIGSVNGFTLLSLVLSMPRSGAWTGRLELDTEIALSGQITLSLENVVDLRCTILLGDVVHGRFVANVVGGAGKLATPLPAKPYRGAPLLLPLQDLVVECGETLSESITATALPVPADRSFWLANVPAFWTRAASTAGIALHALCEEAGAAWRILPDGTVWAGRESWPAFTAQYETMKPDPSIDQVEIACDTALLLPGQTLDTRRVSRVHHRLDKSSFRSTAWLE